MQWYKHDATAFTDAKLKRLRIRYGMEGYGLYWYCLELITQDVGESNLSFELEHDAEILAHDTGIHRDTVEEMMRYMVDLKLFELNENGVVSCLKLAKRLDKSMTSNASVKKLITKYRTESKDYAGYIYFIIAESEEKTKVKIGRSKNPWQRIKELRKRDDCQGFDLRIVATISSDDCVSLEAELHRRYNDNCLENEWFAATDEINETISLIATKAISRDYELLRHVVVSPEEKRREEKRVTTKGKPTKKFTPPTVEQVADYITTQGYSVDPQRFVDHYTSNGWKVGKNSMKDWRAAVRNWSRSDRNEDTSKEYIV